MRENDNERLFGIRYYHGRVVLPAGMAFTQDGHFHLNKAGLSGQGRERMENRCRTQKVMSNWMADL